MVRRLALATLVCTMASVAAAKDLIAYAIMIVPPPLGKEACVDAFAAVRAGETLPFLPSASANPDEPPKDPTVLHDWFPMDRYGRIDAERVSYFQRGLSSKQQADLVAATDLLGLFVVTFPTNAGATLRDVSSIAYRIASTCHAVIIDDETREYFSPQEWQARRLARWDGDRSNVDDHISYHFYEKEPGQFRLISLGLGKFGVPDLVATRGTRLGADRIKSLLSLAGQRLAEGLTPTPGEPLRLAVADVGEVARAYYRAMVVDSAAGRIEVGWQPARRDQGDPNNAIVEIIFDGLPGATTDERQAAAVKSLWGDANTAVAIPNDALAEASVRAKARLPSVHERFRTQKLHGLIVKLPFGGPDGREWMWVEVSTWQDGRIRGKLTNSPNIVKDLRKGGDVEGLESDVFDYVIYDAQGNAVEGGETNTILEQRR